MKTLSLSLLCLSLAGATLPLRCEAALPGPLIEGVINAPNPFDSRLPGVQGQTRLHYTLHADAVVHITVYDLFGFRVQQWDFQPGDRGGRAGANDISWDGTNASGQKVAKGGYLARIEVESPSGSAVTIRKIGVIH